MYYAGRTLIIQLYSVVIIHFCPTVYYPVPIALLLYRELDLLAWR